MAPFVKARSRHRTRLGVGGTPTDTGGANGGRTTESRLTGEVVLVAVLVVSAAVAIHQHRQGYKKREKQAGYKIQGRGLMSAGAGETRGCVRWVDLPNHADCHSVSHCASSN